MRFEELLERIATSLDAASISYMVIGGQAVLVHGEFRVTKDIDITLGIPPFDPDPLLRLVDALKLDILVSDAAQFLQQTFVLPTIDRPSGIRVDLICSLSEYERGAIARAISVGKSKVRYIGLEDLIIHKIIAGRPRDIEDVRAMLPKHRKIDFGFVRQWLHAHDVELSTDFEARLDALLQQHSGGR